jgi:7-keto-8-aminopelargonate synthetase-like enzyme
MTYVYWLHLKEHDLTEGYIGVTDYIERRFRDHLHLMCEGHHINPYLINAYKKYGDQIIQTRLLEGNQDYCYKIEAKLRPYKHIGLEYC